MEEREVEVKKGEINAIKSEQIEVKNSDENYESR